MSFRILKKKFNNNFLVQDDDIYGSKKLNECLLEPITITVNNKELFSFQDYLKYESNELRIDRIFLPLLGLVLIFGGIFYNNVEQIYKQYEGLFLILFVLIGVITIVYIRYFLHEQY